jgi:CO/xanthine dehydrogenase FAD-binding subunit
MRIARGYDYHRPLTLEEAWRLRGEEPGARLVAGGTDLMVKMMKRRFAVPGALISLRSIPGLRGIAWDGRLRIGGMTTLTEVIGSPLVGERCPVLARAARTMGRVQVRNVATLGGNLCNASPAADTAPPLLVLEAAVVLEGPRGRREIPLREFLLGPGKTALAEDEVLTAVLVPPPPPGGRAAYLRKGRVRMDLAVASVAAMLVLEGRTCRRARLAAGAVGPVPMGLPEAEAELEGREVTDAVIARAAAAASLAVRPITDLSASADHRRRLVSVLLRRAVEEIVRGGGPP